MTPTKTTDWDTEEVLAFVHDVRPWRDLDETERGEWVRRVKHIRDNVTTDSKPWSNVRLSKLLGISDVELGRRFRWSEDFSLNPDPTKSVYDRDLVTRARRALRNPEMAAEMLAAMTPDELSGIVEAVWVAKGAQTQLSDAALHAELDDYTEDTPVRMAQRALGHADAPKRIFETGALYHFREGVNHLAAAHRAFEAEGIRKSDLDYSVMTISDLVHLTNRLESDLGPEFAERFREALHLANAEIQLG